MDRNSADFGHGPANLEEASDGSESDLDDASDAMLGGLRLGLRSIRRYARKEVGKCANVELMEEMKSKLETSALRLIAGEQMFLETARIVTSVVDDICSDPDVSSSDDEDENGNMRITVSRLSRHHNDDKPRFPTLEEMLNDSRKMSELFSNRMNTFAETLTQNTLKDHPEYVGLQKEITKGEKDFDRKCLPPPDWTMEYPAEDPFEDLTVLPSKDPLSKKLMNNPVQNKYCNHVFEQESIENFIEQNPGQSCPMYRCQNPRPLHTEHFITNHKLTESVRTKNKQ